eukprot:1140897-Pelagomonas_calceolata.AAC.2
MKIHTLWLNASQLASLMSWEKKFQSPRARQARAVATAGLTLPRQSAAPEAKAGLQEGWAVVRHAPGSFPVVAP